MKLTIVILLLIFLILFSGLLTYLIITRTNRFFELLEAKNNAQNNISTREMLMNADVLKARDLMDTLVKNKLIEWQVYNINPQTENFMGTDEIANAITYIIKEICLEMTPALEVQLGFGFPMNTQENMIKSIKSRAMLVVMEYTVQQNKVSTDSRMMKVFGDD